MNVTPAIRVEAGLISEPVRPYQASIPSRVGPERPADAFVLVWQAAQDETRSAILAQIQEVAGQWPAQSDMRSAIEGLALKLALMKLPDAPAH